MGDFAKTNSPEGVIFCHLKATTFVYMTTSKHSTPSVLIVEDEAIIAADIELTLRELGYRIAGKARSGSKALQLLQATSPDIVLLDINLDGRVSGIEVAKSIKKKYAIPFIYLTALADTSTLEEVKATMPYGYIVKPFNENDLRSTIELALYRFQSQKKADQPPNLKEINDKLLSPLSQREYEVLLLFNKGLTYKEVGEQLYIGHNTVKTYQKSLFAKFDVSSRHQLSQKLKKLSR